MLFRFSYRMLTLCGCLLLTASSGTLSGQNLSDTLTAILEAGGDLLNTSTIPAPFGGVSGALIVPSGTVSTAVLGNSRAGGTTLTDVDIIGTAEVSHTILAVLTLALEEEGMLMTSDPISTHIDVSTLSNVPGQITIDQLLSHASGLDDFSEGMAYQDLILDDPNTVFTAASLTQQLVGPPGTSGGFSFSNTNYLVLGLVLEAANGTETLNQSVDRLLAQPAGITSLTTFDDAVNSTEDVVPLFADLSGNSFLVPLNPLTSVFTGAGGAGNVIAAPTDLLQFARALFGGAILSEASLTKMTNFAAATNRIGNAYGLGIERFEIAVGGETKTYVGHTGNINYPSVFLYSPEDSVGVSLVSNNAEADVMAVYEVAVNFLNAFAVADTMTSVDSRVLERATFAVLPNPAVNSVNVSYDLLTSAVTQWQLFDLNGRQLLSGALGQEAAGTHQHRLNVGDLPRGTYLLRLRVNDQATVRKLLLN
ncbi:MAG: serine hydrolase [Bacteroidota bacterium]